MQEGSGSSVGEPPPLEPERRWHLAQNGYEEALTAFEFALLQVDGEFQRFAVHAMQVAADLDLAVNEVVALHVVRMQERAKDTATIAQLTNREDLPNLQYNLRKLVTMGLLVRTKSGTSAVFRVTEKGREITDRYAALRRQMLTSNLTELADVTAKLQHVVRSMHILTGLYAAASRDLATINPAVMFPSDGDGAAAAGSDQV
ncbi:transcriptional regulator [Mycolicibacterium sp. CH28]|uniref:helix-turn-helix domain-containing protein n=1 Tax=Mycolicibacterium sp. CH28 TaxID=2512237 RepID=UPI00108209D1|nr:winged helix DNA-binding protein [Mycolicibacterium sp. CH28]TGD88624.1 transcriptional regulator [Mycolicibacterium sp. CH28]